MIGAAEMKLLMHCDRIPSVSETVVGKNYMYLPGGRGTNTAVAISKLGGDCVFCSCLGEDDNGVKLRQYYNERGIDTRFLAVNRTAKTGFSVNICEKNDRMRTISFGGAPDLLTNGQIEEAFTCYPDAVYVQTVLNPHLIITASKFALQQKIPFFLEAVGMKRDYPFEELEKVEIFSTSADDVYNITGIVPTDMENCLKAAMAIEARVKAKLILIRIPRRGVYIYDGKYYQSQPTYDMDCMDTSEATDAYHAALVLNYLSTGDIKNACAFACAVGEVTSNLRQLPDPIPTLRRVLEYISTSDLSIKL